MNDETNDDLVEAVKDIADVAGSTAKAIENIEKTGTGRFIGRVFGEVIENGVGMVGDAIKFKRFELHFRHVEKTKENLKKRGVDWDVDPMKTVPPKVAIPIFENASLEEDDGLHTLWSNLLANALDKNSQLEVNRVQVSILKELEPIDVLILKMVFSEKMGRFPDKELSEIRFEKKKIAQAVGADIKAVEMSLLNLMRVSCIKPGLVETEGISFGGFKNTVYQGTDFFHLSELGVALCLAAMTAPE